MECFYSTYIHGERTGCYPSQSIYHPPDYNGGSCSRLGLTLCHRTRCSIGWVGWCCQPPHLRCFGLASRKGDAVVLENKRLNPSKIFKIKNQQLKIQNSLVGKDIIHHSTLAGGVAGSRATEFIIAVLTLHHEGTTTSVCYYRAYTSVPKMD